MPISDESGFQSSGVLFSGTYEPVRKSHFLVNITDYPDGIGSPTTQLQYFIKNFTIPELSVEVKTARFANHHKSYPGERTRMPATPLVIRCFNDPTTYQFFVKWWNKVYDRETDSVGIVAESGGADDVSGTIEVTPVNVDGAQFVKATLQFAWPSAIKFGDMDRDDDGNVLDFSVIFQCNDVEVTF